MLNVCSSIRTRPSTISCPHHILPRTHTHNMHPNNFSKSWKELKIKRLDKSQNNAMHFVAIIFLPLFVQSFSLFAVPAMSDFIFTIHLNVLLQQNVHCPLKILPLQIVLIVRYYMYIFLIIWLIGYPLKFYCISYMIWDLYGLYNKNMF